MGKKNLLASIIIKTGVVHLLYKLRQNIRKELPVLAYHRILNVSDLNNYPYDVEVIDASIDNFKKQMQFIAKYYNPISIQDLYEHINNKSSLPKNPILITFDDGFNDNYHNAFPILKKYNIPATVFIATNHIGTTQTFWFERLSRLIMTTKRTELLIEEFNFHRNITNDIYEKRKIYNECVELLKYTNKAKCIKIVDELEQIHNIVIQGDIQEMSYPLTWEQCQEMAASVITFGSHGTSHSIFTQLNDEELEDELSSSKKLIEAKIQKEVISLSFPNGQKEDFNQNVINMLKKQGYHIYFSYLHGTNSLSNVSKTALNRMHPPRSNCLKRFKLFLAMPEIF